MSTWTLVGTLPGGAGGAINVHPLQEVGVSQQVKADLGRFPVSAGVSVSLLPVAVVVPETVGVSQDDLVSGTPSSPILAPGVALSSQASGSTSPRNDVGAELVQVKYDLTQTTYATSAVKTGTWASEANAVGANNGTFATNTNPVLNPASGNLDLSFAAQVNKSELVISSVHLYRYWKNVAGLLSPCAWAAYYSIDNGANWVLISNGNTSFDQSSFPGDLDLTAVIGQDWNKLSQLKARFTYTGAGNATQSTISVDAVKLVVVASKTDLL